METLTQNDTFQPIDKAMIASLRFQPAYATNNTSLLNKLAYALRLGNAHHVKVRLYFSANECNYCVETTVWAYDNSSVCLKGGIWIPLHHISDIRFY